MLNLPSGVERQFDPQVPQDRLSTDNLEHF
jgi:hypothetical protein